MTSIDNTVETVKTVETSPGFETYAWRWMRYTGLLLIPLAWGHVLIQDVLVGVHQIDLDYVAARWAFLGWRVYDFFLLSFAFAHGMNGLRQVLADYVKNKTWMARISWALLAFWFLLSLVGAVAIIGGVRQP